MVSIKLDLHAIRRSLEDERARLMERIASETARLNQPIESTTEWVDQARLITTRELQSALLAQAQQHLEHIEAALRRLDEGTYGICAVCGGPINPERLRALPYATTCVKCQRQQEQAGGASG